MTEDVNCQLTTDDVAALAGLSSASVRRYRHPRDGPTTGRLPGPDTMVAADHD